MAVVVLGALDASPHSEVDNKALACLIILPDKNVVVAPDSLDSRIWLLERPLTPTAAAEYPVLDHDKSFTCRSD